MIKYDKLFKFALVKTNLEDADFWIQKIGNVGNPVREFSKNNIGIKLNAKGRSVIDPRFLWYQFQFLHGNGHWTQEVRGSVIPFISVSSVKNILVAVDDPDELQT